MRVLPMVLVGVCVSALASGCPSTKRTETGSNAVPSASPEATRSPTPSPITIAPSSAVFPDLTGKHKVGRKSYRFVDGTREENMTLEPGDKHWVIVTVYYPAGDIYNIQHTRYTEPLLTEIMRTSVGASEQFLSTLVTHAYKDPPAAREGGPFPVVLMWPGTLDNALFYSTFLENLASHGYIAVGVTEPYNASYQELDGVLDVAKSPSRLDNWVSDQPFIMQKLSELNNLDFAGMIDLNVVAVGGHSAGGDTATRVALELRNIKALLNMDGVLGVDQNPSVPALLLSSPSRNSGTRFSHHFKIRGIEHNDFEIDLVLLAEKYPGKISAGWGAVKPRRLLELVNTYSVAFLDKYLKGIQTSLLDGNSGYHPEMQYRTPSR